MHRITIKDVLKAQSEKAIVTLIASSIEPTVNNKRLAYDWEFKTYILHTEEGTVTVGDIEEAVKLYNSAG